MKRIILSFDYDNDVYFDQNELLYSGLKYFYEGEGVSVAEVVSFIKDFYTATGLKGGETEEEVFLKGSHAISKDYVQEIINEFGYLVDNEVVTLEEVIDDGLYLDIISYLEYNFSEDKMEGLIRAIAEGNNFELRTVGYSQWAVCLIHNDTSEDYARSIWDGTDFYTISLIDEEKDFEESVSWVYAESTDELIQYATEYFNITKRENVRVLNNEIGKYIDLPKVEEIREVTYSYKDIK